MLEIEQVPKDHRSDMQVMGEGFVVIFSKPCR